MHSEQLADASRLLKQNASLNNSHVEAETLDSSSTDFGRENRMAGLPPMSTPVTIRKRKRDDKSIDPDYVEECKRIF